MLKLERNWGLCCKHVRGIKDDGIKIIAAKYKPQKDGNDHRLET